MRLLLGLAVLLVVGCGAQTANCLSAESRPIIIADAGVRGLDGGANPSRTSVAVTLKYDLAHCAPPSDCSGCSECTITKCAPKTDMNVTSLNDRLRQEWATCRLVQVASSIFEVDCGSCELESASCLHGTRAVCSTPAWVSSSSLCDFYP